MNFQVPSDLQTYLEVKPKNGVVQGEDSFAAQLKFKPLESLLESDTMDKYYTASDDIWKMPVHVGVAFQVSPTHFNVFICMHIVCLFSLVL